MAYIVGSTQNVSTAQLPSVYTDYYKSLGYTLLGNWAPGTTTTTTSPAPIVYGTPPTVVPPDAISSVTGIDPAEVAAATYNKIIPLFAGGMPRMGGHIIFGPYFTTAAGITYTSFGVSFGMPAWNSVYRDDLQTTGSRELRELRLDGFKVWSLTEGNLLTGLNFTFYPGTETQATDPSVSFYYPTAPVAHKGQCCVFIHDLPLTNFAGKVPFVSAVIADTTFGEDPEDGLTLGQALAHIAGSRLLNLDINLGGEFSTTGISERVDAVIVAEEMGFLELLNRFARLHLWDIVQTDTLEANERGTVAPDLSLNLTNILGSDSPPILIERAQQSDVPRELEYSYIDSVRDYEINTVVAKRPRTPWPATVSAGKDTIALPSVHTVQEAMTWATLRRYKDELARETVSFTTGMSGYAIEPGDILAVDAGFKTYIVRVLETLKGSNWTNRIKAEPVLRCAPPTFLEDTSFPLTGLGATSAISASRTLDATFVGDWYTLVSGAVSEATDQTGNTRHYQQTTAGARPIIESAGGNNRDAFSFDGVDDVLTTSGSLGTLITSSTGYIICSFVADAITTNETNIFNNDAVWCDNSGVTGLHLKSGGTAHAYNWDGNADITTHSISTGITYVVEWKHAGGVLSSRVNLGAWQTIASGNTTTLVLSLLVGAQITGVLLHAWTNVRVIELITFNTTLTTVQEDALATNLYNWAEN